MTYLGMLATNIAGLIYHYRSEMSHLLIPLLTQQGKQSYSCSQYKSDVHKHDKVPVSYSIKYELINTTVRKRNYLTKKLRTWLFVYNVLVLS